MTRAELLYAESGAPARSLKQPPAVTPRQFPSIVRQIRNERRRLPGTSPLESTIYIWISAVYNVTSCLILECEVGPRPRLLGYDLQYEAEIAAYTTKIHTFHQYLILNLSLPASRFHDT